MQKTLYVLPRFLGVIAILFISLFALDVFEEGKSLAEIFIGLMIHLIPSFVLLVILAIAWKFELVGGVIFMVFSFAQFLLFDNEFWVNLIVVVPFFSVGILFVANRFLRRKYWK